MAVEHIATLAVANTARGASIRIDKADLVTAGLQDDDLVIAQVSEYNDIGYSENIANTNGQLGWTHHGHKWTGGHDGKLHTAYKVMTDVASEPTVFFFDNEYLELKVLLIGIFRGVDPTTPLDAAMTVMGVENNVNPNAPDITTVSDNALIVTSMAVSQSSTTQGDLYSHTAPSGFELGGEVGSPNTVQWADLAMAYKEDAGVAGANVIGTWASTAPTSYESGAVTLAFKWDGEHVAGSGGGGGDFAGWSGDHLETASDASGFMDGELLSILRQAGATSHEVVGALNELNGTFGVEYMLALRTWLASL